MADINDTYPVADAFTDPVDEQDSLISESVFYTLFVLHGISSSISLIGNLAVIIQNVIRKRPKSPARFYLISLACSGILLVVFCVPFTVWTSLVNYTWIFGQFFCTLLNYVQTGCVLQYSFILMASSLDRCLAICRPLRPRQSSRRVSGIIVGIWIISFAIPAPIAFYSSIVTFNETQFCVELWPTNTYRQIYSTVLLILTYVIPLGILIVTYTRINVILGEKPPGEACKTMLAQRSSARKKNIWVFILAFGSYCVCWLPIHVITVVGDFKPSIYSVENMHVLWLFAHWLAMSNSSVTAMISISSCSQLTSCLSSKFHGRKDSFVPQHRTGRRLTQETII